MDAWWSLLFALLLHCPVANEVGGQCGDDGVVDGQCSNTAERNRWEPKTISVVLPCANEAEFALKTVKAVWKNTPRDVLHEIVVVDDGSSPALEGRITEKNQRKYDVKLIRHPKTLGLIQTKHTGGAAASGDIVVFFDCHVAPVRGWHDAFLNEIGQNYKRIVVPQITDLNIDTWKERNKPGPGGGHSTCYMTWDVDFKWVDAPDKFVPVLSGGLLGMSRRWWNETDGYDDRMRGWGGENVEQSLRTWLCGGEIVSTRASRVAHMWRTPQDPRTTAKYRVSYGDPTRNKMRAALAWMGNFSLKLSEFPQFVRLGIDQAGDIDNIAAVREKLDCKPFAWFLHRFRSIYEDGGLVPKRIFHIQDTTSKLCLTYQSPPGVHPGGRATAALRPCDSDSSSQRWHRANRDTQGKCCSSFAAWNTDQCLSSSLQGGKAVETGVCDISGEKSGVAQRWSLNKDGQLMLNIRGQQRCLVSSAKGTILELQDCSAARTAGAVWKKVKSAEPLEMRLYREELLRHPEWNSLL